jgi:hypothetical protein
MSGTDPRDAEDVAWLEARERGASVLPQIGARRAAAYDDVQALIAALPDEAAPAGWEDEVMAALPSAARGEAAGAMPATPTPIEDEQAPIVRSSVDATSGAPVSLEDRRVDAARRARGRWIPVAAAVAAAAGLLLWWQHSPAPSTDPSKDERLSSHIIRSQGSRSSDASTEAAVGDVLQVEVTEENQGELRIYRDDREVVVRCPGQAECAQASGRLTAELRLSAPGRYRAVYLRPAQSISPTGTLDGDLAVCRCASRTTLPIVVR